MGMQIRIVAHNGLTCFSGLLELQLKLAGVFKLFAAVLGLHSDLGIIMSSSPELSEILSR